MANITEIKNNILYSMDELYQKGYDLGWQAVIENLIALADNKFNQKDFEAAKHIEWAIKIIEGRE